MFQMGLGRTRRQQKISLRTKVNRRCDAFLIALCSSARLKTCSQEVIRRELF